MNIPDPNYRRRKHGCDQSDRPRSRKIDAEEFSREFFALLGDEKNISDRFKGQLVEKPIRRLRKLIEALLQYGRPDEDVCHTLVISNGGTLMGADGGGGIAMQGDIEQRFDDLNIHESVLREVKLCFYELFNADSILMNMPFWRVNAVVIAMIKKYVPHLVDAILVGHGSDTKHIGAANTVWMLPNLDKPLTFVGALAEDGAEVEDAPQNVTGALLASIVGARDGISEVMMSCSPANRQVIRAVNAAYVDGKRGYESCAGTEPLLDWSAFTPGESKLKKLSFRKGAKRKGRTNKKFEPHILPSKTGREGIVSHPNIVVLDPTLMSREAMEHHIQVGPCVVIRTSHASVVNDDVAEFLFEMWHAGKILCLLTETTGTQSSPEQYVEGNELDVTLQKGVPFGAITDVAALTKLTHALARFDVCPTNDVDYGPVVDRKTQRKVHAFMRKNEAREWVWQHKPKKKASTNK